MNINSLFLSFSRTLSFSHTTLNFPSFFYPILCLRRVSDESLERDWLKGMLSLQQPLVVSTKTASIQQQGLNVTGENKVQGCLVCPGGILVFTPSALPYTRCLSELRFPWDSQNKRASNHQIRSRKSTRTHNHLVIRKLIKWPVTDRNILLIIAG